MLCLTFLYIIAQFVGFSYCHFGQQPTGYGFVSMWNIQNRTTKSTYVYMLSYLFDHRINVECEY